MNVKPGDLAVIIKSKDNAGAIGTVIKFHGSAKYPNVDFTLRDLWSVHFERPISVTILETGKAAFVHDALVKDAFLRKIAGPDINTEEIKEGELLNV